MIRRLAAVVVTALVAVVLPASAASAEVAFAVGTVTGVTSGVNERTPLYNLELTFTLADVQCPAVIDYEMGGDTLSAPVDQCAGDPAAFFASATATTMRPMFGEGLGTINPGGTDCDGGDGDLVPGCQVDVFVRHADAPLQLVEDRTLKVGGVPVEVPIPPRPVWVGVGDGYTSRVTQMADWCFEASPDAEAAGREALGTSNVFADDYPQADGKYDYFECAADVPAVDPATGFEVYLDGEGFYYFYDRDTDTLWYQDESGEQPELVLADPGVTLDDLERELAGDFFKTGQNVPGQSWINAVVQTFNDNYEVNGERIPCDAASDDSRCWFVVPEVIADVDVTAAELADAPDCGLDPTHQLCQLEDVLTSERHQGSWNWIGMSAGLVDAGIPQAIQAQYPTDVDDSYHYESLATGYVPWRPAAGDPCPALPTISAGTAADIQAGIENVVTRGMAWSPGLKSIVVRYPWLTEVTPTDEALPANPCAPANRAPITALNAAIDAAVASFPGSDDVYELNLAAELDLNEGFTDEPTDSVPGRQSFLQLTRPYGYPYPSDYGSTSMGSQAYDDIEKSGLQPPTIEGVVVQADDDDPASPSSEAAGLLNSSGWYRASGLWVEWRADAPEGVVDLSRRSPLLRGANRNYTGTVVDGANQTATAPATVSWDPDPPVVASTLSGGIYNPATGWYRSRPKINWVVTDVSSGYTPANGPSGVAVTPSPISTYADGKNQVITSGVASDVAGNTATGQRTLSIDTVPPILTYSVSTGTGWSNAASATVTWTRSDATSGVAGVSSHPQGLVGTPHNFPSPAVTAEGRTPVSHTVTDMAGHTTTQTVDVLLDRTAPRVFVQGGGFSWPDELDAADLEDFFDDLHSRGCTGKDDQQPAGVEPSGYDRCTIVVEDPEVGEGELLYTVVLTAWDKAGNSAVEEHSFTVEVTDPPTLTGEFVTSPNAAGWWKTSVQIDWEATPALGIGLYPALGDLYSGNWNIASSTGVGAYRSTHPGEGIYTVTSPTACNIPQPGGSCAPLLDKSVKIDKTPPRVDPEVEYSGPSGSGGWFRAPVVVRWLADDLVPFGLDENEVSGVAEASVPGPTTVGEGVQTVSAGQVSDRAGNTNSGSVEIKVDSEAPVIDSVTGVTEGGLHTQLDLPSLDGVECNSVDLPKPGSPAGTQVSTLDSCTVARFIDSTSTGPFGPPLKDVSWNATAIDKAGNVRHETITSRLLDVTPGMNGRMTVGGELKTSGQYGTVSTSGTLRCNGSPNNLGVSWSGGSFTLDWIDYFYCWDEGDLEGNPDAPIDTLYGVGSGTLGDGGEATMEWVFGDRGEPAKGNDTMWMVIKDASGQTVLEMAGTLTGGNFQAHDAQGNGTNDNGNVNGPTGNTSNSSAVATTALPAVIPTKPELGWS